MRKPKSNSDTREKQRQQFGDARSPLAFGRCLIPPKKAIYALGYPSVNALYIAYHRGVPLPPFIRFGRQIRFDSLVIEKWLDRLAERAMEQMDAEEMPAIHVPQMPHRKRGRPTKAEQLQQHNNYYSPGKRQLKRKLGTPDQSCE